MDDGAMVYPPLLKTLDWRVGCERTMITDAKSAADEKNRCSLKTDNELLNRRLPTFATGRSNGSLVTSD